MAQAAQVLLEREEEAGIPTGLELVISKALDPVAVFTSNGLDPILARIEEETLSIALDMSTVKGRKEIASLAHKVAVSKTTLDKMGKDLVAVWKEKAKRVDTERARAWNRLEALQKQVRQPLTEWEDADKARVAQHEYSLAEIANSGPYTLQNWQALSVEVMQDRLAEIREESARDWQEFSVKAKLAVEGALHAITAAITTRQNHDSEQAELARLRKEEEERKQRARDEQLMAEAAELARVAAEQSAKREAERAAVEKAKAEQDRLSLLREKEAAEARAAQAESDRIATEQKAASDKQLADDRAAEAERKRVASEKKAIDDARLAAEKAVAEKKLAEEAAATRERQRIDDEKRAIAEATAKREADKELRRRVNAEACHVLKNLAGEETARKIIEAVAKGQIPHISISY